MAPQIFLENIVILCFERLFSKQNSVICLRSNILPAPIFGLAAPMLLPSTEVGICYLRMWRRGESLLFILKRCRRVYTAPAALVKTAQKSSNSTGKVAFHY